MHLLLSVSHLLQPADELRGKPSSTCSNSNFVQAFAFSGVQFRVGCVCGGHGWVACAELAVDSNVGFLLGGTVACMLGLWRMHSAVHLAWIQTGGGFALLCFGFCGRLFSEMAMWAL